MGSITVIILLGLAALTSQKSPSLANIVELAVNSETQDLLLNLLTNKRGSYHKDVSLKINSNTKKLSSDDEMEVQSYLSKLYKTKSSVGDPSLNKKLSKHLDRLQERVLGDNINDPKCKCKYLSKIKPGIIKCQCDTSSRNDDDSQDDDDEYKRDDDKDDRQDKDSQAENFEERQERSDEDGEDGKNKFVRVGGHDKNDGYWTDDTSCGCEYLRERGLRCRCNSPDRLSSLRGDKNDGYWSDDNSCYCKLLRNKGDSKDKENLRCACDPAKAQRSGNRFSMIKYVKPLIKDRMYDVLLSDFSDDDNENIRTASKENDYQSLNALLNYVLNRENDVDLSNLSTTKRKILLKLRDIVPNLRNVDENELKQKIVSIVTRDEHQPPMQRQVRNRPNSKDPEVSQQAIKEARHRLLKIVNQQRQSRDKENSRRAMQGRIMGVPFTLDIEGLAQINN